MSDTRLGGEPADDDRLPWLEAADEKVERDRPAIARIIAFVIAGILLLGALAGGYSWWVQREATSGDGGLIAAPGGPYKVKPADPGGMNVQGEGQTAFAASEGAEPQGRIDMGAVPETPIDRPEPRASTPATGPKENAAPVSGSDSGAASQAVSGSIQLGAFSSQGSATSAWKALSTRFAYLEPLTHSVVPEKSGDKTLYRLRANGPGAANICGRLRIAGETCLDLD